MWQCVRHVGNPISTSYVASVVCLVSLVGCLLHDMVGILRTEIGALHYDNVSYHMRSLIDCFVMQAHVSTYAYFPLTVIRKSHTCLHVHGVARNIGKPNG